MLKFGTGQITGTTDADGAEALKRTASAYSTEEWEAVLVEEPAEGE